MKGKIGDLPLGFTPGNEIKVQGEENSGGGGGRLKNVGKTEASLKTPERGRKSKLKKGPSKLH